MLDARNIYRRLTVDLAEAPMGRFVNMLSRRWQRSGALRRSMNDPQIMGCGFCILGVLCEAWMETVEAQEMEAKWEGMHLTWQEGGVKQRSNHEGPDFLPGPVARWWDRSHQSVVSSEELNKLAPVANDHRHWSFDQFSVLLATRFGVSLI